MPFPEAWNMKIPYTAGRPTGLVTKTCESSKEMATQSLILLRELVVQECRNLRKANILEELTKETEVARKNGKPGSVVLE